MDAQRLIARKAVDILPQPLSAFFEAHLDTFEERVVEPDAAWPHDRERSNRVQWHRVAMDVAATEPTREARMEAARDFTRDRMAAKRLYRGFQKRGASGELPWVIADYYEELVAAFRENDHEQIVRTAGYLTHFACDAAFPFSATADYDGKAAGNLHLGRLALGHPLYAHANVARRFEGELVRRNRSRLDELIDISEADFEPVDEPIGRARAVLLGSLAVLDDVLLADAEIIQRMQVTEGNALLERSDEYYVLLDQRCGGICRDRLIAGTAFAANLVAGAWSAAGKPTLEAVVQAPAVELTSSETPKMAEASPANATAGSPLPGGSIVGSSGREVFHFYNCVYAQKIAPENLVQFKSIAEALAQGRRPCKFCDPK
jgi:hypothetical protein